MWRQVFWLFSKEFGWTPREIMELDTCQFNAYLDEILERKRQEQEAMQG